MIKISFFVEGQTERIFLEKFLDEYLTITKITVESHKLVTEYLQFGVGNLIQIHKFIF